METMQTANPIQRLYDDKQYGVSFIHQLGRYLNLPISECELCDAETPTFVIQSHYEKHNVCMVCESVKESFK